MRRESGLSILHIERWHGPAFKTALARFSRILRRSIAANPELFLPVTCLFVWQFTAIAAKPVALMFALLLTAFLCMYGYRVLGETEWLRRLGWVSPRQGFWFYASIAGVAAGAGVWWIARIFHQTLGCVPPPHRVLLAISSGPMIEELLFRGLLFWLTLELLKRRGMPLAVAISATVFLTTIAFAFSHNDRQGPRFYATILTGIAFGWMRVQSGSTAAATLMHGVYNLLLSLIAMLSGA
jgi:membrane protease YdiL (CAAX protease family)